MDRIISFTLFCFILQISYTNCLLKPVKQCPQINATDTSISDQCIPTSCQKDADCAQGRTCCEYIIIRFCLPSIKFNQYKRDVSHVKRDITQCPTYIPRLSELRSRLPTCNRTEDCSPQRTCCPITERCCFSN